MRALSFLLVASVVVLGCKKEEEKAPHAASAPAATSGAPKSEPAPAEVVDAGAADAAGVDAGAAETGAGADAGTAATTASGKLPDELYATFKTNQGDIVVQLFPKDAPKTVANFVELAQGKKEWTDPRTGQRTTAPLYDGVIFHRVIPNFMIQGGDPLGRGLGGPGYEFEDEFQSGRRFDKPGLLAMANRGPNTNGSQFFITTSTPSHLNNRHTIFGEVISGYDVVEKISNVPTGAADKPLKDVVIQKIVFSEKAPRK